MSKGRLKPEDETSVQQNYCYLKENVEALDLVDYLYQSGVVTTHEKEQIYAEKIKKYRNEILLNILLNSGAGDSFFFFLKSLETQYESVLQRLLGEGNTIEDRCSQGQVDTLLKKENDALKAEKEKNELLRAEIENLKIERRCIACRQQNLSIKGETHGDVNSSQVNNENEKSNEITGDCLLDFVCETTGLSNVNCFEKCPHILGQHEHQITKNGETDLQMCKALCKKNPGHVNFIEVDKFGVEHLPEGYQDVRLLEHVKAVASLTVKISVTRTSPYRPQFWPDTQIPYPLYDVRGQSDVRTGSGTILSVRKCKSEYYHKPQCPCDKCTFSNEPCKIWWEIYIATATNLVFDSVEARHTTVTFTDDQDKSCTISFHKLREDKFLINFDECILVHAICDKGMVELISKLKDLCDHYYLVARNVPDFSNVNSENKLVFLVSYPHGHSKMVSLGQWK